MWSRQQHSIVLCIIDINSFFPISSQLRASIGEEKVREFEILAQGTFGEQTLVTASIIPVSVCH